ncbi:type i inositol polyphosphate 5-phosphatase 4 [Citrus sinensis]|nr:type i inositol polyphosphate 5-phosphatase 4 [Citrus sinensis]
MRDGNSKKSKLSWPKTLVKKWFNIKNRAEDFQADDDDYEGGDEDWGNNFAEREACTIKKSKTERSSRRSSDRVRRGKIDHEASQVTDVNNYKIFVATWNVAGKSPPSYLNLEDWLQTSPPADIYVLGFQEIVPLNAGNVLGTENNGPARKWLALIRKTLNSLPGTSGGCHTPSPTPDPIVELDADFEGSTRPKASSFFHRRSFQSLSRSMRMDNEMALSQPQLDRRFSVCDRVIFGHRPSDYDPNFRWGSSDDENGPGDSPVNTHYSPVTYSGSLFTEDRDRPCGPSRYCLVASKQMVGIFLTVWVKSDLRDSVRNMKVSCVGRGLMGYLGNKLRIEQRKGHVFNGWSEGKIYFPPTYKYSNNSDRYAGEDRHPKEKRRTPAWCDRILWYGRGLHQLSYVRGESRFSDHRPVYSIFLAEVESVNRSRIKKSMSCSSARIEVEELLPQSHGYSELNLY